MEITLKSACVAIRLYGQARGDINNPNLSHNSKVGNLIQEEKWEELFSKKEWIDCLMLAIKNETITTDLAIKEIEKYFPVIIKELSLNYKNKKDTI